MAGAHVFVVGIDDYGGSPLWSGDRCVANAKAFADKVRAACAVVVLVENPTMANLREKLDGFLEGLSVGCTAVVYFCGLAYGVEAGDGYLVPAKRAFDEGARVSPGAWLGVGLRSYELGQSSCDRFLVWQVLPLAGTTSRCGSL